MVRSALLFIIPCLFLLSCLSQTSSVQYVDKAAEVVYPKMWKIYAISDEIILLQGYLRSNSKIFSTLFRSNDGGKNWIEVYTPPKPSQIVLNKDLISCGGNYEFSFLENGTGWLVATWGASGEGQYKLTVDFTKDFGASWSRHSEIDVQPSYELLEASFFDENHGQINLLYMNTVSDRIAFLTTMDGGLTWQETGSLSLYKTFWDGNKLKYFDAVQAYVEYNFPKAPYETSHKDHYWKVILYDNPSEVVIYQKNVSDAWVKVGVFP